MEGGSALPLVRLHLKRDEPDSAAAVARLALANHRCPDATEFEALLDQIAAPPPGWADALAMVAAAPSLGRWRSLIQWAPPDRLYHWHREAVRRLRVLGVDGDVLFTCACNTGLTSDTIAMVQEGCVSPAAILKRAEVAGAAKGTYLGLAAEATFLTGDMLGAVRLLRASIAHENDWCTALPHVWFIRENATAEQKLLLDRAGIPAV